MGMTAKMLCATITTVICLLAFALAQDNATTKAPTVSLFLPMGHPDRIEASIISANLSQTAFELTCGRDSSNSSCMYSAPITVTEGESTILFTETWKGEDQSKTMVPLTVECQMVGAHIDQTPIHGATSAVCTARSTIAGLGIAASTSTLAKSEVSYVPVTITAGAEKLAAATSSTGSATSTAFAEAPPRMTAMARLGTEGALLMALLGVL